MSTKIRPSSSMRNHFQDLLSSSEESISHLDLLHELTRRGAEMLIQEALEAEVDEFVNAGYYERNDSKRCCYRNGYQARQLRSTNGKLHIRKPRVRDNETPFESDILTRIENLSQSVEKLATEMYVRGLSTRDIEETFVDTSGKSVISRSSVSRITESLMAEYKAFSTRDLSDYDVVYLFVDGVYESIRGYTNNQAVLCAWAICSDGRKVLLHLGCVESESSSAWELFFDNMKQRGLKQPLLSIADGGKGAIKALAKCFPRAQRQRCLAHKLRNLLVKVPKEHQEAVKKAAKGVYYHATDKESAKGLAEAFIEKYATQFPSMIDSFNDDLDACLIYYDYPSGHHRSIRTTNLIERSFVEEKRRTKIIPNHINEKGMLKLVYGTLIRSARRWLRVTMDPLALKQLSVIRATRLELVRPQKPFNQLSLPYAA